MEVEHVHSCLVCTPDLAPDFDRDDPKYHDGEKCGRITSVLVDAREIGYTSGCYEGREGWVIFHGKEAADVHVCPNHERQEGPILCAVAVFGTVEVTHECPAIARAREARVTRLMAEGC